jgi:hypothetical protein
VVLGRQKTWFVEVGDQRHRLGKHPEGEPPPRKRKKGDPPPMPPDAIMQAYYRLMATSSRKLPAAETLRVCQVCDLFLDYSEKHHTSDTYRSYKDFLQDFCGKLANKNILITGGNSGIGLAAAQEFDILYTFGSWLF